MVILNVGLVCCSALSGAAWNTSTEGSSPQHCNAATSTAWQTGLQANAGIRHLQSFPETQRRHSRLGDTKQAVVVPRTFRYKTCPRRPAVSVLIIFRSRVNSSVLSRGIIFAQASLQYVARSAGDSTARAVGMLP